MSLDKDVVDLQSALPKLKTRRASDIETENIRWLWPNRMALGKLSLIAGDAGLGKSQITIDMTSRVTRGEMWPADGTSAPPGSVMLISAEDDAADTVVPRLTAAGADLSRVHIVDAIVDPDADQPERELSLRRDLSIFEDGMPDDCVMVVIDPISAYLDGTDSHSNAGLRELLTPLAKMAQRKRVAVIAVSHLNKGSQQASQYRVVGSIAFTAAPRAVYVVVADKDNPSRRLMLPIKNNLGDDQTGFAYCVSERGGVPYIEWESGLVEVTAEQAMSDRPEGGALEDATAWLEDALAKTPVPVKELKTTSADAGHAWATMRRAKDILGVKSVKSGFGDAGAWVWQLTDTTKRGHLSTLDESPVFADVQNGGDAKVLRRSGNMVWGDDGASDEEMF